MTDFPRSLPEFQRRFPDEVTLHDAVAQLVLERVSGRFFSVLRRGDRPMQHSICDALMETLSSQLDLSRSRLQTLALLIIGMVNARTVNLSHLASQFPGEAHVASSYRRLQRFFQHVRLAGDWSAPLVVKHLGLSGQGDRI